MNKSINPFEGVKIRLEASSLELILSIPDNDAINQVYSALKKMVDEGLPAPIVTKQPAGPEVELSSPIGFSAVELLHKGDKVGWLTDISQCIISELTEFNAVYVVKPQYRKTPSIYLINLTDGWRKSLGIRGNHSAFSTGLKNALGFGGTSSTGSLYYGFSRTASNNGIADFTGRMLFMDRNAKIGPFRAYNKLKLAIMTKGVIYRYNEGLQFLKSHGLECECKICKRNGPFIRWYKK